MHLKAASLGWAKVGPIKVFLDGHNVTCDCVEFDTQEDGGWCDLRDKHDRNKIVRVRGEINTLPLIEELQAKLNARS